MSRIRRILAIGAVLVVLASAAFVLVASAGPGLRGGEKAVAAVLVSDTHSSQSAPQLRRAQQAPRMQHAGVMQGMMGGRIASSKSYQGVGPTMGGMMASGDQAMDDAMQGMMESQDHQSMHQAMNEMMGSSEEHGAMHSACLSHMSSHPER